MFTFEQISLSFLTKFFKVGSFILLFFLFVLMGVKYLNKIEEKKYTYSVEVIFRNGEKKVYNNVNTYSSSDYKNEVTLYFDDKELIFYNTELIVEKRKK